LKATVQCYKSEGEIGKVFFSVAIRRTKNWNYQKLTRLFGKRLNKSPKLISLGEIGKEQSGTIKSQPYFPGKKLNKNLKQQPFDEIGKEKSGTIKSLPDSPEKSRIKIKKAQTDATTEKETDLSSLLQKKSNLEKSPESQNLRI
jgi:hypothetical protein